MGIVGGQTGVGQTDKELVNKQIVDGEIGMGLVGQWIGDGQADMYIAQTWSPHKLICIHSLLHI